MSLASGATFAGYTILRMLGFGGMGEVYLAGHPALTRHVTLKVLPATMTGDDEFRERFLRETDSITALSYPNIVDVHDRGEFDGRLWVAMDYVDGINAAQQVAERYPNGMPAGEVLAIVAAVAGALDYAHRQGIVHGAVKPSNIMLSKDQGEQRILLTDFGIARRLGQSAYAAPEQTRGDDPDGRADQYGLAATAVHLFTGVAPSWSGGRPPQLSERHPELAPLDDVFTVALAQRPADRFGRCSDFSAALSERAAGWVSDRGPEAFSTVIDYPEDAEPPKDSEPAQPAAANRKRLWVGLGSAAAAALLVSVGLAVGIMIGRNNNASPSQAGPTPSERVPSAAQTSTAAALPAPGQLLDGTYQIDINRAQQTFNDMPNPQPPNVTTWWAFRASCTAAECIATGVQLDDEDHQTVSPAAASRPLVLDFRDGAWHSRPEILQFPCVGPHGEPDQETTTQALWLQPQDHGPLRGVMTVTVETDECGQQGGHIVIPAVAGRVGAAPPGVTVPGPSVAPAPPPPDTSSPSTPPGETPAAPSTPGR
ncbi:serine/threonine-protein kinase [Mycobacterium shimoidei]|uniref:non-specific serine/threonine protein kinase n=1 Tax=Mycobacterium shimoidei TaxID=29313 RepID=A0A1E3T6A7_MYCSH|nr:serine/threonine-protein kinase [Mycobacterium shimoidei]MCV7261407.1 serine/threonine protein kinase [Mycobacterium shimoidei]ODR09258.1 hypothetical protein BHQ16_19985 [Mycobacterium shimoidei]ORW77476.1 hypothetical protein AWC26_19680 [Mycobacterium shimoidei]SRX95921.1 putative transmembrane serine/threonine-protein kinase I PknI (protein kinase I) (STPK I) (phosphorylase B kinase kinase) (hydroxyalkyl-protein kinase) [Mycobacterium tuberculosis H37Rv] [Mycobacterium shimoidei]